MLIEEPTLALKLDDRRSPARRIHRLLLRYGLPLSLLCLLALGFATYVADGHIAREAEWRRQAYQDQRTLHDLQLQLNIVESEQRGFVITGDTSYLTRYREHEDLVKQNLNLLRRDLTDAEQRLLLARLKPLVLLRLDRLDATLAIRRQQSFDAARQAIVQGPGKALMDQISAMASELEARQSELIVRRERDLQASFARSRWMVLAGTVWSLLVLILLYRRLVAKVRERNQMVSQLRDATAAAEAANAAKSELLTNVSQEIQSPLRGALGLLDRALEDELTPQQRRDLETAHATSTSVTALIQDILDLSRIETGRLVLASRDFRLHDCLQDALATVKLAAQTKGLRVVLQVDSAVPALLTGDSDRLRQVVLNLVHNALKFTDYGEIAVRVSAEEISGGWAQLHFEVTGVRMVVASSGGAGLGLTLASQLIEQMDGRTWAEGTLGTGTTFHFSLRFAVAHARIVPAEPVQPHQHAGLKILMAEDNPLNERFLVSLLVQQGHRVTVAHNGREAVERASGDFDVILMDIQMPEMDGLTAAAVIREKEAASGGHVPMVALTAQALKGDRERCIAAGMDHYLAKPVRPPELIDLLARIIGQQPVGSLGSAAPSLAS